MLYQQVAGGYLVRLERGEELVGALATLMEREALGAGAVTGLGAVSGARLGFYELGEQRYRERAVEGEHEVCGLTGTLSWYQGRPFPHLHLLLSGPDFQVLGGHCFEATVAATLELFVRADATRIERRMDEAIGLHLMGLSARCPLGPGLSSPPPR